VACTKRFFNVPDGAQAHVRVISEDPAAFTSAAEALDQNGRVVQQWDHAELTTGGPPLDLPAALGRCRLAVDLASPAGAQALIVVALVDAGAVSPRECLIQIPAGGAEHGEFSFFFEPSGRPRCVEL